MDFTSVRLVFITFPVVFTDPTSPDKITTAEDFAHTMVSEHQVACVNLLPGVTSLYHWQGEICRDAEVFLMAKTTEDKLPALREWVMTHHPYECPEFVVLPVLPESAPAYLHWIQQVTH
jgi:periplasmic divalent cation tolerance protein